MNKLFTLYFHHFYNKLTKKILILKHNFMISKKWSALITILLIMHSISPSKVNNLSPEKASLKEKVFSLRKKPLFLLSYSIILIILDPYKICLQKMEITLLKKTLKNWSKITRFLSNNLLIKIILIIKKI